MIPHTSFMNNVRKVVTKESWDIIRRETYAKYGHACGTCGATDTVLECHEIWEFDDVNQIQKLNGLIALCSTCHRVKHFGFALHLADQGQLDIEPLIKYFMKVNRCRTVTFKRHFDESVKIWEERSKKLWAVDLGECAKYVKQIDENI
jgi:5-methylcytosine-specific restriction endonuclease McrA